MKYNFAVFILTFGRPEKVITYNTLKSSGYTGNIYLLCSNDDNKLDSYKSIYKEKVLVFDKKDYINKFDICDNFNNIRGVVYARNAIWDIVKKLNLDYFLVLDDDYNSFMYRFDNNLEYKPKIIKKSLDKIFYCTIDYLNSINSYCIAFSQGGDFFGGKEGMMANKIKIKRKIMNSFFLSTKNRFEFLGRLNEDVNAYLELGRVGKLVFQTNQIGIEQLTTQKNSGGLTELYLDEGTYIKSFYSIIISPSSVKINLMGKKYKRLHHIISWNNTTPLIIDDRYKKL